MIFDDISKNILRRFQWPRGGDCKYVGRPSVYRIARDLNVHPKVVRLRLKELFDSGLIRGVKFYTDDAFMPWKRYFVLINKTKGVHIQIPGYSINRRPTNIFTVSTSRPLKST